MLQNEGKDRISALSNTLLSIILSFMQTKETVRTCVLSKRWKYVWTKVPVFDFAPLDYAPSKSSFISFVYKALAFNHAPELKIFRLSSVDIFEDFHVQSWIWSIMRRGVVEVELCSFGIETKIAEGIFSSEKLRVLKLSGKFIFSVLNFKLPNLKILHLSGVILKDSLYDINSVFPLLGELVLYNWSGIKILNIHSCSLRMLKIRNFVLHTGKVQDIVIEAPNLEYLFLSDNVSVYDIRGARSLIEAKINVCKQSCAMRELLHQISGLRSLRLSIVTIHVSRSILFNLMMTFQSRNFS